MGYKRVGERVIERVGREGEKVGREDEKESRAKGCARKSGANRLEREKVG